MNAKDEQRPDARAQAVQRIVADLLGESDAAERAQMQADLADDPSLAAERERLSATIGLVRDFAADASPATLSPEAAARLATAAARNTPLLAGPGSADRVWYATPVFRAAAGFALVLGAFALWQGSRERMELRMAPTESVATAGGKRQQAERSTAQSSVDDLRVGDEPARDGLEQRGRFDAAAPQSVPAPALEAPKDAAVAEGLTSLGYGGGAGEASLGETQIALAKIEQLRVKLVPATPPHESARALAGSAGAAAPVLQERAEAGGSYKGAGDAVPPGGPVVAGVAVAGKNESRFGGQADLRAPAAEPQPAALKANSTMTGADEFFLGRGEGKKESALDERELLRGLGYLGDDGDDARARRQRDARDGEHDGRSFDDRIAPLSPQERARSIEQLLLDCRRRPDEHPRDMFYRWWGDNPFEYARTDALSTFAVDVDTASYTLARRYLVDGILPTKQQIRTEEFVNYFKGDVPAPSEDTFAVATELAPSPFNKAGDAWTLRVALRGREVSREQRQPLALTFVVDVSGSMKEQNRLELVKHALRLLVGELDARDSISIVAFTNDARLVLPMTSARQRGLIESAIHPLSPEGGTNVQAGLRMGYAAALAGLDLEAHNRVVLLSDGVGNIGETDAAAINHEVESARKRGVWLNTVGVGMGNHNDAFLEQLADKGDGICNYIDDEREARRALVDNFTGAFEPIARDVKIQVEFDPAQVERYRLLGYENRAIADADFRNDAVDAGEIGAGHQVVALYEVVRTGDGDGPLATVRVRWKLAGGALARSQIATDAVRERAWTVDGSRAAGSFAATTPGFRRSVLVGQLAEVLRRSIHARDDSLETLLGEARKLALELADPDFDEFVAMVERTIELAARDWGRYDDLARRLDQLRMQHYLKARLEDVARDLDRAGLQELDGQIRALEDDIRRELEQQGSKVRSLGYSDGVGNTDDR